MKKILQFPQRQAKPEAGNPDPGNPRQPSPPVMMPNANPAHRSVSSEWDLPLPEMMIKRPGPDILKAMQVINSAVRDDMAFVIIGIKPTERGAAFYRVIHGDPADLRNAYEHIHTQVDKAFEGIL